MELINLDGLPDTVVEWIEARAAKSGMDVQTIALHLLIAGMYGSEMDDMTVSDKLAEQELDEWRSMMAQIQ